jgi:DNA replication initiation complex subunit (GINS family)
MKRRVRLLRDLPGVRFVGRELGPFAAGEEVDLWPWEAEVLERNGFVVPVQKTTPLEVRKLILSEERSSALAPLPEDFFLSLSQEISALRRAGEVKKADELKEQALTLVEIRLPKLLQLSLSPESASGLSIDERFLVNSLADIVEDWKKKLSESLEKTGEEAEKNGTGGTVQHPAGIQADIQK